MYRLWRLQVGAERKLCQPVRSAAFLGLAWSRIFLRQSFSSLCNDPAFSKTAPYVISSCTIEQKLASQNAPKIKQTSLQIFEKCNVGAWGLENAAACGLPRHAIQTNEFYDVASIFNRKPVPMTVICHWLCIIKKIRHWWLLLAAVTQVERA